MLEVWSRIVFHDKVCSPYFDDDWILRLLIIAKGIQEQGVLEKVMAMNGR